MRSGRTGRNPGGGVSAVVADQLPDSDAVTALLDGLAADLGLRVTATGNGRLALVSRSGAKVEPWRESYPYAERLGKKAYQAAKQLLQVELLKLQRSVKKSGNRVLVIFEGRDAAGKGGTIRRFTENLNPRGVRVVALDKPTEHEQGDNYLRRYLPHLPIPGEMALFDRSWYNRAGVEAVMGFCAPEEYARFLRDAPAFERRLVDDGVTVIKLWFSVTRAEQLQRMVARQSDPVKRWKLSPVDLASLGRWDEYTSAKVAMFAHTDMPPASWTVIKSNDKKRARLEAIRYVLSVFDYDGKDQELVSQLDPLIAGPVGLSSESVSGEPAPGLVPMTLLTGAADGLSVQPGELVHGDASRDGSGQRLAIAGP